MPKFEALLPGQDPIHDVAPLSPAPTLRGCLVRIGIVVSLIMIGLWVFFNAIPHGQKVVIWLTDTPSPFLSATPGDFTRTPTPGALPTNTRVPSATPQPTTTGTHTPYPERWGVCRPGQPILPIDCTTLNDSPWYNATYAIAQYQTAVAPLTPSATPTTTRTPTRRPSQRPAPNRIGASGGAGRQPQAANPLTILATAVRAETAIPPIPATIPPTFPPQPNCAGGVIGVLSSDPNATPYQVTTTPIPACVGKAAPATPAPGSTPTPDQRTPQFMGTAIPTAAPTAEMEMMQ